MNLSALPRIYRTVRHLRISQLAARTQRLIHGRMARRTVPLVPFDLLEHVGAASWSLGALELSDRRGPAGSECLDLLSRGLFRHLNETVQVGLESPDWRLGPVSSARLWTVTLHYHQWVYQLARVVAERDAGDSVQARMLLSRYLMHWLDHCDVGMPGADDLACNSYAIATRLGWWIRSLCVLDLDFRRSEAGLVEKWIRAAWRQADYLHKNLEWDLRANHLLRDAVGLAWAGRFFEGKRADAWLETATRISIAQAAEQVLDDGGHFERSPSYHLEVMSDFGCLAQLLQDRDATAFMRQTWQAMARFARWIQHADGRVAQLNDSVRSDVSVALKLVSGSGSGVTKQQPVRTVARLSESGESRHGESCNRVLKQGSAREHNRPRGGKFLRDFGLVVWQGSRWILFFDVGTIGPDYQPGHAHADTLTVECSYRGKRLFIDPGSHSYDRDERRKYDRSTAAHNTVCIDGVDSTEVWHIFRVGRRARPCKIDVTIRNDGIRASARHDGYRHLGGRPSHSRCIELNEHGGLQITDQLTGNKCHSVSAGLLVEPGWQIELVDGGWLLSSETDRLQVQVKGSKELRLSVESRPFHPDHGVELTTNRLQWSYHGRFPLRVTMEVRPEAAVARDRKVRGASEPVLRRDATATSLGTVWGETTKTDSDGANWS